LPIDRREFLSVTGLGIATGLLTSTLAGRAAGDATVKAIVFDAFPIFDPRPVFALVEDLFPGRGAELVNAWRTRQFEYQWLRALSRTYADFQQTTDDALTFSAEMLRLDLTPEKRSQLLDAWLHLKAWPDVPAALASLKDAGMRLALLSNATPKILEAGLRDSKLESLFDQVLSTDALRTYKPDPRAYRMAIDSLGLKRAEILFVPFAGWDAAGAKAFGYRTFWVNRLDLPTERLGVVPDGMGRGLADLVGFVEALRR
jgi:2-haloacid dehalogenase